MISGQTGSGKTVAMKFLIEQFLKHEQGAVLAINVKAIDLLTMDQPTNITDAKLKEQIREEWDTLGYSPDTTPSFSIYVPTHAQRHKEGVNHGNVYSITLRTKDLEPNALLGILQNVTDRAAEALPDIFRYWKEKIHQDRTFKNFIEWFRQKGTKENNYIFPKLSQAQEESEIPLHSGTCSSIIRSLESAIDFFDNPESTSCIPIKEDSIMISGKLSVIDLSDKNTTLFGAILLRHLLSKIYDAKATKGQFADVPILIVIDEVHQFYVSNASEKALEELSAIARMGRSEKIGVVFASQNPEDLPNGLTSIVNTRIFFRSLGAISRKFDVKNSSIELTSLDNGYALISSVAVPQINFVKFTLPVNGVKT